MKEVIHLKDQSILDLQLRINEMSQELMQINHSKDKQINDLNVEYHRAIDHCNFLQNTCQRDHIFTIENLKLNLKNMENELFNERIRINYDNSIKMNLKNMGENDYFFDKRKKNYDVNNFENEFYYEKRMNNFEMKTKDKNIENLKGKAGLEPLDNNLRRMSLDKRYEDKNTSRILKENEVINAQILKRCREIVGR